MASLKLKDLHPIYQSVDHEEAIAIANLCGEFYVSARDRLRSVWSASMEGDESAKAEIWRAEGRQSMSEQIKAKIVAADELQEKLLISEATRESERLRAEQRILYETDLLKREIASIQQRQIQAFETELSRRLTCAVREAEDQKDKEAAALRIRIATLTEECQTTAMIVASREKKIESVQTELSIIIDRFEERKRSTEKEIATRLQEAKSHQMIALEMEKATEISVLRQKIAELSSVEKMLVDKEENRKYLAEKVQLLELDITEKVLKLELEIAERDRKLDEKDQEIKKLEAETTKSSYALGKEGESLIYDIITDHVLPVFLYSSAKNMSGRAHVADIHLYLQSPVGKRMKILIDAKNYKEHVRGKEITKLNSDVDNDDEAIAGLMISTKSQISTVKQFQIEKTPKGKYILYLSVEKFDDELRGKAICWAVRILSTIASYSDDSDVNIMDKIVDFYRELELSLKEADVLVKSCQKSYDHAVVMKKNLGSRLESFRVEHLGEMVVDTEEGHSQTKNKQKVVSSDKQLSEDIIIHDEEPALSPMQRYYKANRAEILAKQKAARDKKKGVDV